MLSASAGARDAIWCGWMRLNTNCSRSLSIPMHTIYAPILWSHFMCGVMRPVHRYVDDVKTIRAFAVYFYRSIGEHIRIVCWCEIDGKKARKKVLMKWCDDMREFCCRRLFIANRSGGKLYCGRHANFHSWKNNCSMTGFRTSGNSRKCWPPEHFQSKCDWCHPPNPQILNIVLRLHEQSIRNFKSCKQSVRCTSVFLCFRSYFSESFILTVHTHSTLLSIHFVAEQFARVRHGWLWCWCESAHYSRKSYTRIRSYDIRPLVVIPMQRACAAHVYECDGYWQRSSYKYASKFMCVCVLSRVRADSYEISISHLCWLYYFHRQCCWIWCRKNARALILFRALLRPGCT